MSEVGVILVVEDAVDSLAFLTRTLAAEGHEVRPADSGELALASALASPPDLILLDLRMPGMDGFEVCRRLKASEATRSVPVLFLSATTELESRVEGLRLGAVDFIIKPVQREELLVRVGLHLELSRLPTRLERQAAELLRANEQLAREVAERRRTEEKVQALSQVQSLNQVLRMIRDMNRLISRVQDAQELAREACQVLVGNGRYATAAFILVDGAGAPIAHAAAGADGAAAQLAALIERGELPACCTGGSWGEGPRLLTACERAAHVCPLAPLHGTSSAMSVRLEHQGHVFGFLTVALTNTGGVESEEQTLFAELARDLAVALDHLATRQARDLSEHERARMEAQFLEAQKMEAVGRLAGGVAHDFNNILSVILGYADLVLTSLPPEAPVRAFMEELVLAADRASGLTRQLLAFSRRQILQPTVLNLNDVVSTTEKMLRRLIGEDIELCTELAPDLAPTTADRGQMEQVLMNLSVNARDAMPNGGKLVIATAAVAYTPDAAADHPGMPAGPYVTLSVRDSGSGMSEETKRRLFEPFFTTKAVGKGTGLGLASVYGIVKQSGGHVFVQSELGRGSTFTVYMPPTEVCEAPAPVPVPHVLEPVGAGATVLVVEDDDGMRAIVRISLEHSGFKVLDTGVPTEAAQLCRRCGGPIHLLITDIVMPGLSGAEVAEAVQALRPECRLLFMSGYTDNATVVRCSLDPATSFIQKPFTPRDLVTKVHEVLAGRTRPREQREVTTAGHARP